MEIHCVFDLFQNLDFFCLFYFNRVSIDELQQHTELDTDGENEFTVEEVRVNIILLLNKINIHLIILFSQY